MIQQLGYPDDALKVVKYSRKVVRNNKECVGCGKCVFICPYGAIKVGAILHADHITEKCMGCGACQIVCPHNAIHVKGYEFEEILATYGGAAKSMKEIGARPSILVLSCQWSEYSALDNPDKTLKGKNAMILEVPCFKGMDPVHVVSAFERGFDGVMAVVCSAKDCKLQGQGYLGKAARGPPGLSEETGLLDRFELHELSPRCEGDFIAKFEAFHGGSPCCHLALWPRQGGREMTYRIVIKRQLAYKKTLFEVDAPDIAAKARPGQFLIVIARARRREGALDHMRLRCGEGHGILRLP